VLVKRKGMLKAAWSYPHKRNMVRQMSGALLRESAVVLLGRRMFGFKGATENYISLARKYGNPEFEQFVLTVANSKELITGSVDIVRRLRDAGYHQCIGTNMGRSVFNDLVKKEGFSFLHDWFDIPSSQFVTLDGVDLGLFKPRKEFFQEFLTRNGLAASSIIFIDDRVENIRVARAVGMRAIRFTSPRSLERRLKKMQICIA